MTAQTNSDLFGDGALSVRDAAAFTGVKRTKLYELMGAGRLPYALVGSRRLIARRALVKLLSEAAETTNAD